MNRRISQPSRTRLLAITIVCFSSIANQAQSPAITPGQAAAITAEETRHNEQDLGGFSYARVTHVVDSVSTAKKSLLTPAPAPGTVSALLVEHFEGGKGPQPGYKSTIMWLEPRGNDVWKAGFTNSGDTYSTLAEARSSRTAYSAKNKAIYAVGEVIGRVGSLGFLALVFGGIFLYVRWVTKPKVVGRVTCVNPSCRKEVRPPHGTSCENCTSTNTRVIKMPVGGGYIAATRGYSKGAYDIVKYCFDCKIKGGFNTRCPHCGTDLRRVMIERTH